MRRGRGRGMLVLAAMMAVAVGGLRAPVAGADSKTVSMAGQSFSPKTVEISAGDRVVWEHDGGGSHSVTADDRSFDSSPGCSSALQLGCMSKGDTYSKTFSKVGSFPYYCKVHGGPGGQGMSGVVVVKAAAPATTAPAAATSTTRLSTTTTRPATTTTSRPLSTSSTAIQSTTTTVSAPVVTIPQNEAPDFNPGDEGAGDVAAASQGQSGTGKGSSRSVGVIVALLLAVASGGGVLLWRLRPGRS